MVPKPTPHLAPDVPGPTHSHGHHKLDLVITKRIHVSTTVKDEALAAVPFEQAFPLTLSETLLLM